MTKNKFYIGLIIGLVTSNLLLAGFILFKKPPPHRKHLPRKIIIKKLNFNEDQIERYNLLIDDHKALIEDKERKIIIAKNQLYRQLAEPVLNDQSDSLLLVIANAQKEIEGIHFNHFKEIKNLCNSDQQELFTALAGKLANIFTPKKPRH